MRRDERPDQTARQRRDVPGRQTHRDGNPLSRGEFAALLEANRVRRERRMARRRTTRAAFAVVILALAMVVFVGFALAVLR